MKFKDVSVTVNRKDFTVHNQGRNLSMDFDLKRKPSLEKMYTVKPVVEGKTYEIANFDTDPYTTPEEFLLYKRVGGSCASSGCLRTLKDWQKFFGRLDNSYARQNNNSERIKCISDIERSKIMTLIMGYRFGFWDIPELTSIKGVDDKIAYINTLNESDKPFTKNDWKNCRRPERKSQMLDNKWIVELLKRCNAVILEYPAG